MSIRSEYEKRERNFLASFACPSANTQGRPVEEKKCPVRTAFQLDRDRIVYSNAFRRLKHKTQVFLSPLGDDFRTRLTHTLEVAQIARTVARALFLNEDLAEAIALGHDLGHTPFGHSGETALKEIYSSEFLHNEQSLRVVDVLENNGHGLNLTHEVRDGILKHSKGYGKIIPDDPCELAQTIEGQVVRVADIMAYLNHDLDDAIRSRVISFEDAPKSCLQVIGPTHSVRAATMVHDLITNSGTKDGRFQLSLSNAVFEAMTELRIFLYERVYRSPRVHNEFVKAKKILSELYQFFMDDGNMLNQELAHLEMSGCNNNGQPKARVVCDLIASLTDRAALNLYGKIFFPSPLI